MGKKRMLTHWPETAEAGEQRKLAIRLEVLEGDHARLKAAAAARGVSMSTYARISVLEQIRRDEKEAKR